MSQRGAAGQERELGHGRRTRDDERGEEERRDKERRDKERGNRKAGRREDFGDGSDPVIGASVELHLHWVLSAATHACRITSGLADFL
jgi:hypothetical protein